MEIIHFKAFDMTTSRALQSWHLHRTLGRVFRAPLVSPAAASDSIGADLFIDAVRVCSFDLIHSVASSGSSAASKGWTSPLTGRHSAGDCVQKAAIHHKSDAFEGK
jgi:hypothetical protein